MDFSGKYTAFKREELMQQVQMQMSVQRFQHVLGVEEMAIALAAKYGVSTEKASIAALTHDYAKERPDDEFRLIIQRDNYAPDLLNYGNEIWHGRIGASLVQKELGINDKEILQAIRLHTTGAKQMSPLDKVIYVADYIEPGRNFPGVEVAREKAMLDLDEAVAYELYHTVCYLIKGRRKIYPKTIEAYNEWVVNVQK